LTFMGASILRLARQLELSDAVAHTALVYF
jgi:hypothetical protein